MKTVDKYFFSTQRNTSGKGCQKPKESAPGVRLYRICLLSVNLLGLGVGDQGVLHGWATLQHRSPHTKHGLV